MGEVIGITDGIVGRTNDELVCSDLSRGTQFKVLAKSSHLSKWVVEFIGTEEYPRLIYIELGSIKRKR